MEFKHLVTLEKARETYGNKNQILVCIEELNELACVLAKFPRYDNENEAANKLHDAVLDEVADVTIILDHVKNILMLTDEEVESRINKKVSRLARWLDSSSSMQETVDDRVIEECKTCENKNSFESGLCTTCMKSAQVYGKYPFYRPKEK